MSSPTFELKNEIYKAGAGAGKTTKLTHQVIEAAESFYQKNQRYPHIVVTTFTRKATQELKERLLLKACEEQKFELLEYFSSQQRIHISTIHGVLSLFLRRYGHLFELDNNFQLIAADAAKTIFQKVLREQLKTQSKLLEFFSFKELLKNTMEFYPLYFEHPDLQPPSFEFLQHCLDRRWNEFKTQILQAISDIESQTDNQKWLDYVERIKRCLGLNTDELLSALSDIGRAPVERKNITVDKQTKEALSDALKQTKAMLKMPSHNPENWPALIDIYKDFYHLAQSVCEKVMQEKVQTSSLEMQDLELLTLKIIRQEPEIAAEFAKEWDYWLVDEYQDTAPIQVEILKHLIADRPHFTVGDPQQSIYLFRGADVSVFQQKQTEIESKGGVTESLLKNYRSEPELLEFFNDTFTKLSAQFVRMTPKKDEFDCHKNVATLYRLDEPSDELEAMASEIVKLKNQGASYEQICVLARKNDDLLKLASAMDNLKIPYHLHQPGGFNRRREVLDLIHLLKFFVNPYDNHNLLCLLRSPWFKVSDQVLIEWTLSHKKSRSYWQQIDQLKNERAVETLKSLLKDLPEKGYVQSLESHIQQMVDWAYYQDSSGLKEANIFKFLYQLKMAERQPDFNVLEFLNNFSSTQSVDDGGGNTNAVSSIEPSRVQLMTVHASKGLQFNYVLLPFLGAKPKPPSKSGLLFDRTEKVFSFAVSGVEELERFGTPLEDLVVAEQKQRDREEFLRVFYVALTRAKSQVIMSWSKVENHSWAQHLQDLFVESKQTQNYSFTVKHKLEPLESLAMGEDSNQKLELTSLASASVDKKRAKRFSVSDILALEESSEKVLFQGTWQNKLQPVLFGIEFHALLESYKYNPEQTLEKIKAQSVKTYEALKFLNSQTQFPFLEICKQGEVEWGFQMQLGQHVVEGQIDLWGEAQQQVWVVDYKTGSSKNYKKSLKQLKIYALAVQKIVGEKQIMLVAAYPFEEKVFTEELVSANSLEGELINLIDQNA